MDGHMINLCFGLDLPLCVGFDRFQLFQGVDGVLADELAEDGVFAIEMRGGSEKDEELTAVGGRTFVGHAYDATSIVAQRWTYLVFEKGAIDGGTDFGTGGGG